MKRIVGVTGLYVGLAVPLFLFAFRHSGGFRVELGGADESFRRGAWSRDYEDQGPFRIRRGARVMTYFQARMAEDGASLSIPAVVRGGDAELRLRLHRYGRPGILRVFANGVELEGLEFREDSYPWDVRSLSVPAKLLERGPVEVSFDLVRTTDGPGLASGGLAGFDWVELRPSGAGARLSPTASQWLLALGLPVLVALTASRLWPGLIAFALVTLAYAAGPGSTAAALSRIWIAFPLGLFVFALTHHRALSAAFTLTLLAASTVIFWPDHFPPDTRPHLRQVRQLELERLTPEVFWRASSSWGKDGRTLSLGRPNREATYVAPYTAWSYFAVNALRRIVDEPRFWVEFLALTLAAGLIVLVFYLARALIDAPEAAMAAAGLMGLEIATWHHASRAHLPALFGMFFFVAAATYLARRHEAFHETGVAIRFGLLSLLATLSYSATLLHFIVFIAWLTLFERAPRVWLISAVAGTLGSVGLFYRHFLGSSGGALLGNEGYRAPATFLFLRNQVRDTKDILVGGYPAMVLLAAPALWNLKHHASEAFARRFIWAWVSSYLFFLVLKDPAFFPKLFLQIKEDLLLAPMLAVLGGAALSKLLAHGRRGKLAAGAILILLALIRINDYLANADTIHGPTG